MSYSFDDVDVRPFPSILANPGSSRALNSGAGATDPWTVRAVAAGLV